MSKAVLHHPGEEELLRYADGELAARKAGEVRSHLEACWQCRTELDQLQKTIGECVRYRESMQAYLPVPPARWADLERRFDEMDAAEGGRWRGWLRAGLRWAPAAVAAAVVCGVFYQLRETPRVEAAVLLRKAAAAEEAHAATPRRIRIRTGKRQSTRVVGARREAAALGAGAAAMDSIEALFRAAHYSWEDPLSAKSYQEWRDRLPAKRDTVTTLKGGETRYRIRTTTDVGELVDASLTLRAADLRPVEGRLEFRDREWVELEELAAGDVEPAPVAAAVPAPAPVRTPAAAAAPAGAAHPPATFGRELQVLAALHQVGADLGDPVEVARDGSRIVVSGVGVAPERQQQIHAALDRLPDVVVRFAEPSAVPAPPEGHAVPDNAVGGRAAEWQARMENAVGGRADFERLAAHLLDLSEGMMARAYAARRLAQRFPPEAEAELTRAERQVLGRLNQEHLDVLAREAAEIERVVAPVLAPLGGTAGGARATIAPGDSWQAAAEKLFQSARRVETLLAAVLGVADAPGGHLPADLLSAVARLRANAEACGRAVAAEKER